MKNVNIATTLKRARDIMGRNIIGIDEAVNCFRLVPTRDQIIHLSRIPIEESRLVECSGDTHILVAVMPVSVRRLFELLDYRLFASHREPFQGKKYSFLTDKGSCGWQLIRKTPVNRSCDLGWDEQQRLLGNGEKTPCVRVVAYAVLGTFLAQREKLFVKQSVRCSDCIREDQHDFHFTVGFEDDVEFGISFGLYGSQHPLLNLGLAAAFDPCA